MPMDPRCLRRSARSTQPLFPGSSQDPGPRRFQGLLPLGVGAFVGGNQGGTAVLQEVGIRGKTEAAVHDDRLGIGAFHQPDVEAGIVGQHRADAHQDGLVGGPEAVGQGHGLGAAERQGTPGAVGNAAVQTLGVTEGDEGAAGAPAVGRGGPQALAYLVQDRDDFFHRHDHSSLPHARRHRGSGRGSN